MSVVNLILGSIKIKTPNASPISDPTAVRALAAEHTTIFSLYTRFKLYKMYILICNKNVKLIIKYQIFSLVILRSITGSYELF